MKRYSMSFAASITHVPLHPERTAKHGLRNWDVCYQVWSSRKAMAKSIRMQEKREYRQFEDWSACVPLTTTEGF